LGAVAVMAKSTLAAGEAAATANARIAQINDSMGLFGATTEKVNKRIIDYANATARATGVDQNQIKLAQAKLLTFGQLAKSADEAGGAFDRATKAAIDMGAAGFGTAEMNAVQLGKALNDPIKGIAALAKSGVTFTEQEKDKIKTLVESNKLLEAQDMVLKAIETQVGGTAEATANDSDKMKVAFSQLSESIGLILLPLFQKLGAIMMKVADFARENSTVIVILGGVVAGLAVAILAANAAMKIYNATLIIAKGAQMAFNFVVGLNPITLVIIAVAALVAALIILEKRFGIISKGFELFSDGFNKFIINPIKQAIGFISDLIGAFKRIPGVGAIGGFLSGINIPGLAEGGIVTKPTLAMIGERGPEAVVPLGRSGGVGGVTINVSGGVSTSAEIGQAVYNSLLQYRQIYGPLTAISS
jgi:hypothetical protein